MSRRRPAKLGVALAGAAVLACSGGGDDVASNATGGASAGGTSGVDGGTFPQSDGGGTGGTLGSGGGPGTGPAFLHANLWSTWWNDRTRCGAERAFLHMCQNGSGNCSLYEQAVAACDPTKIVYGQVGPEKQSEPLCQQSKYPSVGGCDASKFDFETLRFWWYGAEWQGNWPWATLKVFPQGADWTGGGELIALSSLPGLAQAAMGGISNHGLGYGCTMKGASSGDQKYQLPFGGFAWIEVPTGTPVTVAAASGTNFGDQAFSGCNRGAPTQSPWIAGAPGATLGCVYIAESVVFEPGKHYYWHFGRIDELPTAGAPAEVVAGFALPEVSVDVTTKDACKL